MQRDDVVAGHPRDPSAVSVHLCLNLKPALLQVAGRTVRRLTCYLYGNGKFIVLSKRGTDSSLLSGGAMLENKRISAMLGGVLLSSFLAIPTAGIAQVASGNLGVKITITEQCALGAISDVDFETVGLLSSAVDAEGTIEVTCTAGTDYSITLNQGAGPGATEAVRQMTGPGGTIDYTLHQDSARTILWGTDANAFTGVGTGGAEPIKVYGRVPSQTTPERGDYSDTVLVTLTY